jgi:polysaccharide pyruvyl transferase WcaK-like protein
VDRAKVKMGQDSDTEKIVQAENSGDRKVYRILLLTNRDSDNVGDQVIEACDISLISAVMKNLNKSVQISSREASIISQKYLQTKDEAALVSAETAIKNTDIVVFGGAPMFNFWYQNFYERTAVTLELAQKYNKPVMFSAIGVEGYSEENKKCQRLKKTLNFDCVKQITTRDDIVSLGKYKENENLYLEKVADPAVFSDKVFEKFIKRGKVRLKKKIGIFVLRSGGFEDNKIDFSREQAADFWVELTREFEQRGYDYELLSSGHFADEAFIDYLIRKYGVKAGKCVFNMNAPEKLIGKISSYDAVISCRLHPSIISFALEVPSIGIVWNTKVKGFYESIGYEDRIIEVKDMTAKAVAEKTERIIAEGVTKDAEYLMSVYRSLFRGIKNSLCPDSEAEPYTYDEIMAQMPVYQGASDKEMDEKVKRKFRRTYKVYNDKFDKNIQLQKKIEALKAENKRLKAENKL